MTVKCQHKTHRVPDLPEKGWLPGRTELIMPDCAGREEWLKARTRGIGGSEIGALMGVGEYMTPFDVYNTKINGGKDLSHLAPVEWGHRLEEAVGRKTADELGMVARPGGGLYANSKFPYALVTPDFFATRRRSWKPEGLIECKTAGEEEGWADGAAPLGYRAQLQWQLGILGLKRGWLGCLVLGQARNFYVVEELFDPDWFKEMLREAKRFWREHVLTGEPPMIDPAHPRTEELMKELHPHVVRQTVQLSEDAEEWQREHKTAWDEFKAAEKRLNEVKNWFRIQLEDAGAGYIGDLKIASYPEVAQSRVDVGALREKYPKIAEEVTVTGTHRRLTISKPAKTAVTKP